jgi:ABC-2 type transport system permease protein
VRAYLLAEWTKTRTAPAALLLLVAVAAVVAGAAFLSAVPMGAAVAGGGSQGADVPKDLLIGVQVAQALTAVAGVLAVGGEYGTGLLAVTLTVMPRRGALLAAKAAVVGGLSLVAGSAGVLGAVLAGRLNGLPVSLADGPTLRAAAGSALYLVLVALLGLGVAVAARDAVAASGVLFGLLFVLAALPSLVADPGWKLALWRISPMNAGLTVQFTTGLERLPIGPWQGLAVTAGWAVAALLLGGLLLRRRDA